MEDLGLSEALVADLKQSGICKLSIEVVREEPIPDGLDSFLAGYILDKELLARVIHACHCCRTSKEIGERVYFLLRQSPVWDKHVMTTRGFIEALLPHLTSLPKPPTFKQIYMAVYRLL